MAKKKDKAEDAKSKKKKVTTKVTESGDTGKEAGDRQAVRSKS